MTVEEMIQLLGQHPPTMEVIVATEDGIFVENNHWDGFPSMYEHEGNLVLFYDDTHFVGSDEEEE
jgi:hypothetical protein